jgi:hypothetical protein
MFDTSYNHLLTCPVHGKSPGCLLCRHVADKTVTTAVRSQTQGEEGVDYFCEQCSDRLWELGLEDVVAVCMHCARECVEGLTVYDLEDNPEGGDNRGMNNQEPKP